MPDALSLSRKELPEEIEKAIEKFTTAATHCGIAIGTPRFGQHAEHLQRLRLTLDAAILSRLGEAEADAARFRALMRCGRIQMQGSAGVNCLTGGRTYPDNPGMVHFGAEFWVQPEAVLSPLTAWGRHCLRALADDIIAYEAAEAGRLAIKDA